MSAEPVPVQFKGRGLLSDEDAARFDAPKIDSAPEAIEPAALPIVVAEPVAAPIGVLFPAPPVSAPVVPSGPRKRHHNK
jgi:hypothetical protein